MDYEYHKPFGPQIKEARIALGLTAEQCAGKCGITPAAWITEEDLLGRDTYLKPGQPLHPLSIYTKMCAAVELKLGEHPTPCPE